MKKINLLFTFIIFCFLSLGVGYYFGKRGYEVEVKKTPINFEIKNKNPNFNNDVDFQMFWQVWGDLNTKYVDKPLDSQKLVWGAIKGMVSAAGDPYTRYLDPNENKSNDEILQGSYEGIGAELTLKDDLVTVVSPFDGSPAKKAGIRPGDIIIMVNKESVEGLSLNEVVKKIKGPKGTEVILSISRNREKPFDVKIVRGNITVDSVKSEWKNDNTLYVRISRFGESTNTEWDNVVKKTIIEKPNFTNIILDLRQNPGGYLNSAVHISSDFIKGTAVIERFYDGSEKKINTDKGSSLFENPIFKDKKLVILVDGGSASASEILSGTLKEEAKAYLIGEKTFGKGSVQEPIDYSDGSGLNVTIAKWLTPSGFSVHKVGLIPDKEVKITDEDIKNEKDPQLEAALEYLK